MSLFFKLCFRAKYNLKPKIILLLFDFPRILRFSFSSFFNVFLLSVFFFDVFYTPPHNQGSYDSK